MPGGHLTLLGPPPVLPPPGPANSRHAAWQATLQLRRPARNFAESTDNTVEQLCDTIAEVTGIGKGDSGLKAVKGLVAAYLERLNDGKDEADQTDCLPKWMALPFYSFSLEELELDDESIANTYQAGGREGREGRAGGRARGTSTLEPIQANRLSGAAWAVL